MQKADIFAHAYVRSCGLLESTCSCALASGGIPDSGRLSKMIEGSPPEAVIPNSKMRK